MHRTTVIRAHYRVVYSHRLSGRRIPVPMSVQDFFTPGDTVIGAFGVVYVIAVAEQYMHFTAPAFYNGPLLAGHGLFILTDKYLFGGNSLVRNGKG